MVFTHRGFTMKALALTIAAALRQAADTIERAVQEQAPSNLRLAPEFNDPELFRPPAEIISMLEQSAAAVPETAEIGTGGRPVAAILTGSEWITLLTDRKDGVAQIAMRHGAKEQTIIRLRQKALKGEVITSRKAPEIFALLREGHTPEEVAARLTVVLPTVRQAMGLLNASVVMQSRALSPLPALPQSA